MRNKKYHTWKEKHRRKHFSKRSTSMPKRGVKPLNKCYWGWRV